ncbi:MAG: hypothetical protein JST86_20485 [Bacteroidetes bacterium]|nr:hypothetical protein [Bacteroidota bacterium]
MFRISIPEPCHVGWENMNPVEKGRYCNSCATTVIDFSVWSDDAIKQYFIDRAGDNICGRFKNTQLERIRIELPKYILKKTMPFWKRFLLMVLICFGGAFMGIDTSMAKSNYTQGQPISDTTVKTKIPTKKLKYKKYTFKLIKTPIVSGVLDSHLVGYTVSKPESSTNTPFDQTTLYRNINSIDDSADSSISLRNPVDNDDKNRRLPEKKSLPSSVFIIPPALAPRNPFSKKKK